MTFSPPTQQVMAGIIDESRIADTCRAIKLSFSLALVCTTSRRIPASEGTNQGHEKGDLVPL